MRRQAEDMEYGSDGLKGTSGKRSHASVKMLQPAASHRVQGGTKRQLGNTQSVTRLDHTPIACNSWDGRRHTGEVVASASTEGTTYSP